MASHMIISKNAQRNLAYGIAKNDVDPRLPIFILALCMTGILLISALGIRHFRIVSSDVHEISVRVIQIAEAERRYVNQAGEWNIAVVDLESNQRMVLTTTNVPASLSQIEDEDIKGLVLDGEYQVRVYFDESTRLVSLVDIVGTAP